MAVIENTAFEVKVSNHEFDSIANITGFYEGSDGPEVCPAGLLCVRTARTTCDGYQGLGTTAPKNMNTWTMRAAAATDTAQAGIYACNLFDVQMMQDPATGAIYKVGSNTLGLALPAGYPGTFTQIHFNNVNVYRFAIGNLTASIGTNTLFTIANGVLVPAAAAPTTAGLPYFELVGSGNFTQGAYLGLVYYDVTACVAVGTAADKS